MSYSALHACRTLTQPQVAVDAAVAVHAESLLNRAAQYLRLLGVEFKLLTFVNAMIPICAALGLQFVTFAITARGLGVAQFGAYTALLALVGVAVELTGLGGGDLLVRAVSRNRASFQLYYGNMLTLLAMTLPVVVLGGVIVAIFGMQSTVTVLGVSIALFGEILVARMSASLELVMVAHEKVVQAGWIRMLTIAVRLCVAAAFFILFAQHSLNGWIVVVCVQAIIVSAAYVVLAAKLFGRPIWALQTGELSTGTSFCVSQSARAMQSNLDRMVLSRFADDAALGLYGAASRILQLGLFPIQVVMRTLSVKFYVHGAHGLKASRRYALQVAPTLVGVGVFSALCVAATALLAPLVLGRDFAAATGTTLRLACALPLIALQYPAADALSGAGLQTLRAHIYVAAAVGFGFVLVAGVRLGGINGLIYAFLLGHLLLAVVLWVCTFVCVDKKPTGATLIEQLPP